MSQVSGERSMTIAESQQLLRLIFPNYPELRPRVDVDVSAFRQQLKSEVVVQG